MAERSDTAFVAGCLFRVVGLCAHAVHARAGRWVISEKSLIDNAGRLPEAPVDFAHRVGEILGCLGTEPTQLHAAIASARSLLADVADD